MAIADQVLEIAKATGIPFEVLEIDPTFSDTAAFAEKYGIPIENCANTIIVASKKEPKQYAACVVQGARRLDVNHALKELLGSKLSFASAEETATLTGMMIGGVTVFGLPHDLPIFIDEHLMNLPWIVLGGGSRSIKIKSSPEILKKLPNTKGAAIAN